MKRTHAKSSNSFPGRVDSSNSKWNSVLINILLRASSTFSAFLCALRWTELSLRGMDFIFRRLAQNCFNNLFNFSSSPIVWSLSAFAISKKYWMKPSDRHRWGNKHILFRFKRGDWKNASVLPDLPGWIFCKCLRSLDGFIRKVSVSQTKHMGCCGLVGDCKNPNHQVLHKILPLPLFSMLLGVTMVTVLTRLIARTFIIVLRFYSGRLLSFLMLYNFSLL